VPSDAARRCGRALAASTVDLLLGPRLERPGADHHGVRHHELQWVEGRTVAFEGHERIV
jgi:hypothetical protein